MATTDFTHKFSNREDAYECAKQLSADGTGNSALVYSLMDFGGQAFVVLRHAVFGIGVLVATAKDGHLIDRFPAAEKSA